MTSHGGRRGQAERDAITVEIGYALCSAVFAAAVAFGTVAGPALLFDLPTTLDRALPPVGAVLAALLFCARVVSVLVRFRRSPRPSQPGQPGQPSQPGRTSPDS
ncbi:DUF6332 family protein [Streptomyces sp. NPDC090075]|uniref:DUF6332 family protein n=1 Tax=unclassified Streptomyces TaxID=2593676 RepID=UPI003801666E